MLQNMSHIQNHILSKLKNAKILRYSQMHPKDIPNDLFNYHLQYLVKQKYILKSEEGYCLSPKGVQHVADPYTTNEAITSLFKINVITIVSRVVDGQIEILSQLRTSNPSYGKIGVVGGVVLKGEPIEIAATRKLKQETGLDATLRLVACERRIMYRGGELFSDVMFPITYTDSHQGELQIDTDFGHHMWVPIDEAIKNESAEFDSIRTIPKVLQCIKDGSIDTMPFLFAEETQSDMVHTE